MKTEKTYYYGIAAQNIGYWNSYKIGDKVLIQGHGNTLENSLKTMKIKVNIGRYWDDEDNIKNLKISEIHKVTEITETIDEKIK